MIAMHIKDQQFINSIVGTPYNIHNVNGGLNCWAVISRYYIDYILPDYTIDSLNPREIGRVFSEALNSDQHGFTVTVTPKNGDVILFKGRFHHHVGLLFDNKCLHSSHLMGGVSYQDINIVKNGFSSIEFWTKKI